MIDKVYLFNTINQIMAYNETTVVLGGLIHIPVIIFLLKFIENKFNKNKVDYQKN